VAEEASGVYKNVDEVVNVSHELGIGRMVAQLQPLAVMKG
jgi:tRNA-splicing ligase RtcB